MFEGERKRDYQRDYMRRRRAAAKAQPRSETPQPSPEPAKRDASACAALESHVRELEAELARERASRAATPSGEANAQAEIEKLKAVIAALEAEIAKLKVDVRAGTSPFPRTVEELLARKKRGEEERKAARAAARKAAAEARAKQAEQPIDWQVENEELREALARQKTMNADLRKKVRDLGATARSRGLALSKADRRNILACLHPDFLAPLRGALEPADFDTLTQRREKAFQAFGQLKLEDDD